MLYEDRKKEIETIKDRTLVLKLSDADCDRILQKAASCINRSESSICTDFQLHFHGLKPHQE